jgi:hypothetical protein
LLMTESGITRRQLLEIPWWWPYWGVRVGSTLLKMVEEQTCWRSKVDKSTEEKLQTKFDDGSAYTREFRPTLRGISCLKRGKTNSFGKISIFNLSIYKGF